MKFNIHLFMGNGENEMVRWLLVDSTFSERVNILTERNGGKKGYYLYENDWTELRSIVCICMDCTVHAFLGGAHWYRRFWVANVNFRYLHPAGRFIQIPFLASAFPWFRLTHTAASALRRCVLFSARRRAVPIPFTPPSWFTPNHGFMASPSTCRPTKYITSPPIMHTNAIGYIQCTRSPNTRMPINTPQKLAVSRLMLKNAADDSRKSSGTRE